MSSSSSMNFIRFNGISQLKLTINRCLSSKAPVSKYKLKKDEATLQKVIDLHPNWKDVRSELAKCGNITDKNFEVRIIGLFLEFPGQVPKGVIHSFADYVQKPENRISTKENPFKIAHYCALLGMASDQSTNKYNLNEKDMVDYLLGNEFLFNYPIMAQSLGLFAGTSKQTCIYIAQFMKKKDVEIDHNLVVNCLKFGLFQDALDLVGSKEFEITDETVEIWMKNLIKYHSDWNECLQFFEYLSKIRYIPPISLKNSFQNLLRKHNCKVKSTELIDRKTCNSCNTTLKTLPINEFKKLQRTIEKTVLNKEDMVSSSTPEEMRRFFRFLEGHRTSHFDLVIDGLNLSYRSKIRSYEVSNLPQKQSINIKYKADDLDRTIVRIINDNQLLTKFNKILITGKSHMKYWEKLKEMCMREDKLHFFYVNGRSNDDLFFLYAAMQNYNTMLMTDDNLIEHRLRISGSEDEFDRWFQTRQIKTYFGYTCYYPPLCEIRVNCNQSVIHIPLIKKDERVTSWAVPEELFWLCAQKHE